MPAPMKRQWGLRGVEGQLSGGRLLDTSWDTALRCGGWRLHHAGGRVLPLPRIGTVATHAHETREGQSDGRGSGTQHSRVM